MNLFSDTYHSLLIKSSNLETHSFISLNLLNKHQLTEPQIRNAILRASNKLVSEYRGGSTCLVSFLSQGHYLFSWIRSLWTTDTSAFLCYGCSTCSETRVVTILWLLLILVVKTNEILFQRNNNAIVIKTSSALTRQDPSVTL